MFKTGEMLKMLKIVNCLGEIRTGSLKNALNRGNVKNVKNLKNNKEKCLKQGNC